MVELNLTGRGAERITRLEYKEQDLITAKKYISNKSILFNTGSAMALPYEDNYFNTVISYEVIEYIPKNTEDKMFSEVHRVLKNNDKFCISILNDIFCNILDPARLLIGHRHYDINYLITLAKKTGFQIEKPLLKADSGR